MRTLFVFLLLVSSGWAQLSPPTDTTKVRHGQSVRIAWDFKPADEPGMKFFSIKYTFDLNQAPIAFATAVPTTRQVVATAQFTPQYPKYIYYTVSAVYDGVVGESFPGNTIMAERIGPPPSNW